MHDIIIHALAGGGVCLLILFGMAASAPYGWEDSDGFHTGVRPKIDFNRHGEGK